MSCASGSNKAELESYMFFGNLQTIQRAVEEMLKMDPAQVDAILKDGHNWAADHIATSKDDIEEVAGFFINKMEQGHRPMQTMMVPFVQTFESFVTEGLKEFGATAKAKKKKKKDRDGDGDTDFADAKIAQYKAGGIPKAKAMKMSRKFNR